MGGDIGEATLSALRLQESGVKSPPVNSPPHSDRRRFLSPHWHPGREVM